MERGSGPQAPPAAAWRRIGVGAAALAAAGLLVTFAWPREDAGGAPQPVAARPPASAQSSPPAAAVAAPAEEELPPAVQRYLDATVYPPGSGRLTEGNVDLLHPNARYERPRPVPGTISDDAAGVVRYLLTADRYHLEAGATAHATLGAWRGSTPVPGELRVREATLVAEGCVGAEGRRVPVAFASRGDGLEADLSFADFGNHHGWVLLEVRFAIDGVDEIQRDELRFFHTPARRIPARLLPDRFRDEVYDGSLRLEFGVEVREPGFYRFDANLFGPGGQPVAFASYKGDLRAGVQSVPMEVYGKVLRDAGVPGPYRVDQLRGYRFIDGGCPDRENLSAMDGTFTTAAYSLDVFTDAAHMSDHKRRMIEMMLADHARGIGPEFPDLATPGGGTAPPAGSDDDFEPPPPPAPAPRRAP